MQNKKVETSYNRIDGKWLLNSPYICVHRIAVDSADEVKALGIDVGDMVCFASEARQIQDKVIAGKAMDDRTGCYVMIEAMKRIHGDVENDIYFVGTSSEEVGVRGGKTATHLIDPDIVFALAPVTMIRSIFNSFRISKMSFT